MECGFVVDGSESIDHVHAHFPGLLRDRLRNFEVQWRHRQHRNCVESNGQLFVIFPSLDSCEAKFVDSLRRYPVTGTISSLNYPSIHFTNTVLLIQRHRCDLCLDGVTCLK